MLNTFEDLRSAEQLAAELTEAEIDQLLDEIDVYLLQWSWSWTARQDQWAATLDESRVVGLVGGRGSGKTRTGSEWIRHRVGRGRPVIFGLVGRTAADVRDTMIQGESGILSVFPPSEEPKYTPTARRIDFVDGSYGLCFSAEEPKQIRGPQFHYAWADELAAWDLRPDDSGANAWDNLNLATRLGRKEGINPQILFTTTPKRLRMLREILLQAKDINHERYKRYSIYNQASTFDNVYLAETYLDDVTGLYRGTRLEGQELLGLLGTEVEGAMWDEDVITKNRVYDDPGKLPIRVVGVDPSTADNPRDECGIVAFGATPKAGPVLKRTGYVLADRSLLAPPKKWAKVVVDTALEFDAEVIAEANQGGAMVRETIHGVNPSIRVRLVSATMSKKMRAEPVAMATQQSRIKFFRRFPELEDQMTTWVPDTDKDSPDRVDALVHAAAGIVTLAKRTQRFGGRARTSNPAKGRSLGVTTGRWSA